MLVLTRKEDEQIVINTPGGLIEVEVKRITGNQVRIGITAPKSMHIYRKELDEKFGAQLEQTTETETRPAA